MSMYVVIGLSGQQGVLLFRYMSRERPLHSEYLTLDIILARRVSCACQHDE